MKDSGKAVQTVATIFCVIGILAVIIVAIGIFKAGSILIGLVVLVLGILANLCLYVFVKAFGELVSNTYEINEKLSVKNYSSSFEDAKPTVSNATATASILNKATATPKTTFLEGPPWICPKCGEKNNINAKNCINCFTEKPEQ